MTTPQSATPKALHPASGSASTIEKLEQVIRNFYRKNL